MYVSKKSPANNQFNTYIYYPTSLCRVQITPKTSTNITRYLYYIGPVRQVFSQRASDEFDSSYEKKFVNRNFFSTFFLDRNLKVKNLKNSKDDFFPVVKSEINCASDGVVETTKTSLPCSPAVDQSVSWISRANSVPLRILLSRIPRK